jgi:aspartyl-tRNA(Asn)/glutamyl-tRNA(Gln) amidotransferase subunit B
MTPKLTKTIANIITSNLIALATKLDRPLETLITKTQLIDLAELFESQSINNQGLVVAIEYLVSNPTESVETAVTKLNLIQVNDEAALIGYVDTVISNSPNQVNEYKAGKVNIIGYLVGQCMKESNKSGNPAKFKELLEKQLA